MNQSTKGVLLSAGGIAIMCSMDAVAKALGAQVSTFQIVFVRFLGAAIWLALWIVLTRGQWPKLTDLGRQALRGALLVATATMFFYAVGRLPLAVVAALGMTAPLYVTLLGAVVFKERLNGPAWLALLLGAVGAGIIILGGDGAEIGAGAGEPLAWAAALLAPFTYALVLALLKHHSSSEQPAAMTLGQSLVAAVLVLPLAFGPLPELTPPTLGLMGLIGFLGAAGFVLVINGLRLIPVSVFAVIDYTALLWAAVLGFAFFGEIPELAFWAGAILIVGACVINTRRSARAAAAE